MSKKENIISCSVPVTLDGRELTLRFRAFAFITYTDATGRDLLRDIAAIGEAAKAIDAGTGSVTPVFTTLRDVLWAGLLDLQPELTRDAVARMFDLRDAVGVMPAIAQAIQRAMPELPKTPRPTKAPMKSAGPLNDGLTYGQSSESDAESAQPNSIT